jgi:peptidase E
MMNKRMYALVGHASKITQDNYPESLGQLFITNAPWAFTAVWAVVKSFLDEVTRQKIIIVGGGYTKKLLEVIDEDQLASFLGGKNTSRL